MGARGDSVQLEVRHDCVRLVAGGSFSLPVALNHFRLLLETASRLKLTKALCDVRNVSGEPTLVQRFEMGQFIANLFSENPEYHSIRLAVLGNEPIISPDRFAETVARNRGATGKVFTDPQEAAAYLDLEESVLHDWANSQGEPSNPA